MLNRKPVVAAFFAAAPLSSAIAQVSAPELHPDLKLLEEHVLVTAPLHKPAAETALPVTVLTGDELLDRVANTLGDTLELEPGISSATFGPSVSQPVIRGQGGNRVQILQNGIVVKDAASVSPDHVNAVEPLLADSIEVLRGPSTLFYGSGAIGGVVNVIDNRIPTVLPEQTRLAVEYRHNTVNDQNTGLVRLDTSAGNLALHVDGLYYDSNDVRIPGKAINGDVEDDDESTDGFIGNSNARAASLTAGMSWVDDWGSVGFAASRIENNYGIPPGAHEHHHEHGEDEHGEDGHEEGEHEEGEHGEDEVVRIDLKQNRYDLKAELLNPASWIDAARMHLVHNEYEHLEFEGSETGTMFKNDSWNFRGELVHSEVGRWHGALGLDLGSNTFEAVGEEAFIPKSETRSAGIFLVEDFQAGDWTLEFGGRVEGWHVNPEPDELSSESYTPISLSVSGLWAVNDRNAMIIALSHSERAPQVEELYSNATNIESGDYVVHIATGAVEIGDPSLNVEASNNLDLGWRYSGNIGAGVNLYYNRFTDYIYLRNTGLVYDQEECAGGFCPAEVAEDGVPVREYTQEAATFYGVEVDANFPLWQRSSQRLDIDVYGDFVRGRLDDSGEDVPRLPPATLGSQLNYSVDAWSFYLRGTHGFEQDKPGENETPTDAWTRVDAAAYVNIGLQDSLLTVFVKGNNLTNAEIRNSVSFLRDLAPAPGRGFELGLRYTY